MVTVTVVVGGYYARPKSLTAIIRLADSAKARRFKTPARLYSYETVLERLPQHLQDMASELGQFIQEKHAVVHQRHLAGHRYVAAADQPASELV